MKRRILTAMSRLHGFIASNYFFYLTLGFFVLGALWIAVASLFPMAFDEEFHYGLIKIYSGAWLPYGIGHTSDMAQFGAATGDASYLFHYLMSFPYRVLAFFHTPDTAIIICLRILNIAFVAGALVVFKKALAAAGASRSVVNLSLLLVTLIPIFPLLAAHINYDNLLLLIFAWCLLSIVIITNAVRAGKPYPFSATFQLAIGVLIGMSVKYAYLPLALGMLIWLLWLLVLSYRTHRQTVSSQLKAFRLHWKTLRPSKRRLAIGITVISIFFASHYLTNMLSYGSPIPSCERVFSETECSAYGPWKRNMDMAARKSETFQPLSFPAYMTDEWFPGMTQRLTFAVAGKTNDFDTRLPLPVLVHALVSFSIVGLISLIVQAVRRQASWLSGLTTLLVILYAGVLAFQLYGDYVDTAEPVAINGRYLIPLLPLVAVALIQSIRGVLRPVSGQILAFVSLGALVFLLVAGAGIGTYVVQSQAHWFWPGFGQSSHAVLDSIFERFVLPARY